MQDFFENYGVFKTVFFEKYGGFKTALFFLTMEVLKLLFFFKLWGVLKLLCNYVMACVIYKITIYLSQK